MPVGGRFSDYGKIGKSRKQGDGRDDSLPGKRTQATREPGEERGREGKGRSLSWFSDSQGKDSDQSKGKREVQGQGAVTDQKKQPVIDASGSPKS